MTNDFYEALLKWRVVFTQVTPSFSDSQNYWFGIKLHEETTWRYPGMFEMDLSPGQISLCLNELQLEEKLILERQENSSGEVMYVTFNV